MGGRKPVLEIMTILLMRLRKLPLQILKTVLNIWFQKGGVYDLYNIVNVCVHYYSLVLMYFLGNVYLQSCKTNPNCLSIKSLYQVF